MLLGIDYSSHQGPDVDFGALAAGGYAFATGKVTGGNQYTNPYFSAQFTNAGHAGLVRGIYHYDGEPTVSTGTPSEEAQHFLRHLPDPLPDWTHLALDAEERATRDVARYLTWLRTVRDATKTTPLFYTYPSFIHEASALPWSDLAEFPLWYAWYPNDVSNITQRSLPSAPAGWSRVTIWQYTGGSTVPGTAFPTDLNRFDGTLDDLRALGKAGPIGADTPPPVNTNPGFPGAIGPAGNLVVNGVDFGGSDIVTVEVAQFQARNSKGERYHIQWRAYQVEAWQMGPLALLPEPEPAPAPAPSVGGTMTMHDHGDIPLAKPEPQGGQVVDPQSGYLVEVFADTHQDYALAVWWQPKGWLPAIKYQPLIPGRWLLGVALVVHEAHLKVRLVHCPPEQTADLRDAWLDLGPVDAL